ncbi:hypothetical protein DMC14_03290 [Metamycoplasma phocicerebrale]|uniref:Uncharacterized protein n=1 Tax=Metamycoplasma phocicerebrale TaxID=142649 RepID=A0A482KFY1_9BACT|nr:hypothetical protein [Metamycoplasma phocicerebrale]QBQ01833.1 hypothetical protein DMC14_03290 [Metamycoplasma phocicerebrale]
MSSTTKKKKLAIILGSTFSALAVSAGVAAIIATKYGKRKSGTDKDQKIQNPETNISDNEHSKASTWDATVDKDYKELRKYIEKLIKALNIGSSNIKKSLSIEDLKEQIEKLEKHVGFGIDTIDIINKSLQKLQSNKDKHDTLSQDKKALESALEKAKDALDQGKAKLAEKLKEVEKVKNEAKKLIEKINSEVEKSKGALIKAEFEEFINSLNLLIGTGNIIKEKLDLFNETNLSNQLKEALDKAQEAVKELKNKLNSQTLEQEKENLKKFANKFKEDAKKAIEESKNASSIEELKLAIDNINSLIKIGEEASKKANELNLNDIKQSIDETLKELKDQTKDLDTKLKQKQEEEEKLRQETTAAIEALNKAIEEAKKAKSINEMNLAIAHLEEAITKANELKEKLIKAKLDELKTELESAINRAADILKQTQEKLKIEKERIQAIKNSLIENTNKLNQETLNTKTKTDITSLTEALQKLNAIISQSNDLDNQLKNDISKDAFKAEYDTFKEALEKAKQESIDSQTRLNELKNAKDELDKKVKAAIQKADAAISEANANKESEDLVILSSTLEKLSKAKTELENVKTLAQNVNDTENINKLDQKLQEVNNATTLINNQKQKIELENEQLEQEKQKIKKQIEDLQEKIDSTTNVLNSNDKNLIVNAKNALETEMNKAKTLYEKNKDKAKLTEDNQNLKNKIDAAEDAFNKAKEAIQNIENKELEITTEANEAKKSLKEATEAANEALKNNDLDALKESQNKLKDAIQKAEEAKNKATDNNMSTLAEELKQKIDEAKVLEQQVKDKIAEEEAKNIEVNKQKINDEISNLEAAINEVNEALKEENKHNLEKATQALDNIKLALEKANETKDNLASNQAKYQTEFDNLKNKINDANDKKASISTRKDEIVQERKDADSQFDNTKNSFDTNSNEFETNKNDLSKVTQVIPKLEKDLENINKLIEKATEIQYDELKSKAQNLKTQIEQKLTEARNKKSALESAAEQERLRIEELKRKLQASKQSLEAAIQNLNNAQGLDEQQQKLDELIQKIQEANPNTNIADIDKTQNVKTEYEAFKQKYDEATILKQTKETEIANSKKNIEDKVKALELETETALNEADSAISNKNKNDLQSSLSKLNDLKTKLEALVSEIEPKGYKTQTDKAKELLKNVSDKNNEVDNELNAETNRIEQVKTELEEAKDKLHAAKEAATNNSNNIDKLKEALTKLEAQHGLSQAKFTEHNITKNQSIPELKQALDALEAELNGYNDFKKNLEDIQKNNEKEVKEALDKELEKAKDALEKANNAGTDKTKLEEAKEALEKAKEALEQAKNKANEKGDSKSKETAENKLTEITNKLTEITNKLDGKIAKEIEDATLALQNLVSEVNNLSGVDELTTKLPLLETEITNATSTYNKYNKNEYKDKVSVPEKLNALDTAIKAAQQTKTTKTKERDNKKEATKNIYNEANNKKQGAFTLAQNAGEDSTKLQSALDALKEALQEAEAAKNLATVNKYNKYVEDSQTLINEINTKIEKIKEDLEKAKGEDARVEALKTELNRIIEKLKAAKDAATNAQGNIDDLDLKLPILNQKNAAAIAKHNLENIEKNTKHNSLKSTLEELKTLTDQATETHRTLNEENERNKKEIVDALKVQQDAFASLNLEIIEALNSKEISKLQSVITKLEKIQTDTTAVKTNASNKHYSSKVTEAEALLNNIKTELTRLNKTLKDAQKSEEERITGVIKALEDAYNDLKPKKDALDTKDKYNSINSNIGTVETAIDNAKNVYDENNNTKNQGIPRIKEQLDKLNSLLNDSKNSIQNAKNKAKDIKEEYDALYIKFKKEEYKTAKDLEKDSGNNVQKINDAITALETAQNKVEQIKTDANAKEYHEIDSEITTDIADIKLLIKNLKAKLQTEEKRIEEVIKALKAAHDALKPKKDNLDAQTKYDSIKSNISTLEAEIEKAKKVYDEYNKPTNQAIANIKNELDNLKSLLDQSQTSIDKAKLKAKVIKDKYDGKYNTLNSVDYKTAKKKAENCGTEIPKIKEAIELLEKVKPKFETIKTEANAEGYHEKNSLIENNISDIEILLENLRTKLQTETEKEQRRIAELKTKLQNAIRDLNSKKQSAENAKEKIDSLEASLESLGLEITNAQKIHDEAANDPKNSNISEIQTLIGNLSTALNEASTKKEELTTKLNNDKKAIDDAISQQENSYNEKVDEINEALNNKIKAKLERADHDLNIMIEALKHAKTQAEDKEYSQAKQKAEELIENYDKKLKEIQKALNEKLEKINEAKEKIKEQIKKLNDKYDNAKLQLNKIDPLKAKIDLLNSELNNANNLHNNISADAAIKNEPEIETALQELQDKISDIQNKVNHELNIKLEENKQEYQTEYNKAKEAFDNAKSQYETDKNSKDKTKYESLLTLFESILEDAQKALQKATDFDYAEGKTNSHSLIDETNELKSDIENRLHFEEYREKYLNMLQNEYILTFIYRKEGNQFREEIKNLNVQTNTEQDFKDIIERAKQEANSNLVIINKILERLNYIYTQAQVDNMHWNGTNLDSFKIKLDETLKHVWTTDKNTQNTAHSIYMGTINDTTTVPGKQGEKDVLLKVAEIVENKHKLAKGWKTYLEKAKFFIDKREQIKSWNIETLNIPAEYVSLVGLYSPLHGYFSIDIDYSEVSNQLHNVTETTSSNYSKFFNSDGTLKVDDSEINKLTSQLDQILVDKPFYKLETKSEYENYLKPYADKQKEVLREINKISQKELKKLSIEIKDQSKYEQKLINPLKNKFNQMTNPTKFNEIYKEIVENNVIGLIIQNLTNTTNISLSVPNNFKNMLPSEFGKNHIHETKLDGSLSPNHSFTIIDHSPNDKTGIIKIQVELKYSDNIYGLESKKILEKEITGFNKQSHRNLEYRPIFNFKNSPFIKKTDLDNFIEGDTSFEVIKKLFSPFSNKGFIIESNLELLKKFEIYNVSFDGTCVKFTYGIRTIIGKNKMGYIYEASKEYPLSINYLDWQEIIKYNNDFWVMYMTYSKVEDYGNYRKNLLKTIEDMITATELRSTQINYTQKWLKIISKTLNNEFETKFKAFFEWYYVDVNHEQFENVRHSVTIDQLGQLCWKTGLFNKMFSYEIWGKWLREEKNYKGRIFRTEDIEN